MPSRGGRVAAVRGKSRSVGGKGGRQAGRKQAKKKRGGTMDDVKIFFVNWGKLREPEL